MGDETDKRAAHTRTEIPEAARERQMARNSRGFASATVPAAPTVQDLPTIPDGIYEVGDEIARGGLGRILAARDTRLNRTVAIKQLALPHAHARARFAREVLITGQLAHPNIIPLHEAGRWKDGTPFYAMKLVEGQSLAAALRATETFEQRLSMLRHVTAVAEAIAYAHNQRIIHRDLKPANVLVGPFGETVVIDWGLAKDLQANLTDEVDPESARRTGGFDTSDGAVLGTPAYMPPEQASGDDVDERADVYALGAMLYQLLSGTRPYAEYAPQQLMARLLEAPPRPIAELVPEAPRDLCAIVDKAMARKPEDRYANAGEMADELKRFETGSMVGAHHYSARELLSRFVKRARGVLITAAIALAVLAVLGVLSFRRIAHERDHARDSAAVAEESRDAEARARRASDESLRKLKLEQARALLEVDPSRSARLIRELDPVPPTAASILAEAEERGVAERIMRGPKGSVHAVAIAGDLILAGSTDGLFAWRREAAEGERLDGHDDRVSVLATAPDGDRIASGSYDNTVRVWNAANLTSVAVGKHTAKIKAVTWLDRRYLASADDAGGIRLWDTTSGTGRVLRLEEKVAKAGPHAAAGRVAGSAGRTIKVWSVDADAPIELVDHTGNVTALALCADGTRLFSGSANGEIWRWELPTGHGVQMGRRQPHTIDAIACSADGAAMTAAAGKRLIGWRADRDMMTRLGNTEGSIKALAMTRDGTLAISASTDKTARIWRHRTGDSRPLPGHGDVVSSLAFDGDQLVTGSWDHSVRAWKLAGPDRWTLGQHSGGVRSVSLSPDGTRVASAGRNDAAVGMWRTDGSGGALWPGHADIVYRVVFSPDGRRVASSSDDKSVRVWDAQTGTHKPLWGHRGDVEEIAFSPDGRWLASASKDDTAWLWDLGPMTGRAIAEHPGDVTSVVFSPSGKRLVSTGRGRLVRVYDLETRTSAELRGHEGDVWSAVFADDHTLLTAGGDDAVWRWDLSTDAWSRLRTRFTGARHVRAAGGVIAVATSEGAIAICDQRGEQCRSFTAHTGPVEDLAMSPDGAILVSAGADASVRIWNTKSGEHHTYLGHTGTVFDVELGEKLIISAGADGRVIRWHRPEVE